MKKFLFFLVALCSIVSISHATTTEEVSAFHIHELESPWYLSLSPEIRLSYFHFSNADLQAICGDGTLNIQAGVTYPFYWNTKIWCSFSKIHGQGDSLCERNLSTMDVYPINLGLRYGEWNIPFYGKGYVQAGPSFYHMAIHNDTDFMRPTFHKNGPGLFLGAGGLWNVKPHLFMTIFVEYSHKWCNHIRDDESVYRRHFTLNGWDFGGGFQYRF